MNKYKLSICIPARNEMFLKNTIEDILKNKSADTEIIVGLDGRWSEPPLEDHPDVNIIYVPESIGQRAMTNLCVKLSRAKYIAKCDAHCKFDEGFDIKLILNMQDNWTVVPIMRNLWGFDWKCYKCGSRWYQGPTPTRCMKQQGNHVVPNESCNETRKFRRKITWQAEAKKGQAAYQNWKGSRSPSSASYCFDSEPHFQYHGGYTKTEKYKKDLAETGLTESMSLQGSFFMCTREKYWELKLCDEYFGSWGNQGIEVAVKTWLSGGKVICNNKTWYAHMFRTQGGDFSFPYQQSGRDVAKCKAKVRNMFWKNKYDKQIYPLSWLIERFWPIPGWSDEQLQQLKAGEKDINFPKS